MKLNTKSITYTTGAALLVLAFATSCGGGRSGDDDDDGQSPSTPSVLSSDPVDGATDVPLNASIRATFSEAMDPATLNTATFTVTEGTSEVPVPGTVVYSDTTAVFWPAAYLDSNASFRATITTGAESLPGIALAANRPWDFSTGDSFAPGEGVNLGTAGNYAILAKTGISTVPGSDITGDIGVSPAAATYITGFSLTADSTNEFSTSAQVTGKVFASDYTPPTPSNLTTAISDMETAFTDAASRAPDVIELGAGDIGGLTLAPGVYKWGTGVLIPTDLTLDGDSTAVWIFQIAGDLTVSNATSVYLAGGALPKNIFWQVSGSVDFGTTSHVEGVVLSQTAITLATGASVNGRLLAQSAVEIDGSTIVEPAR